MIGVFVSELEALLSEARSYPGRLGHFLARALARPLDPAAAAAELLTGEPLAAGPIGRLADGSKDAESAVWMRADPIRLVPDLNAVWVRPAGGMEADHPALPELTGLFAEANLAFKLSRTGRGYLCLSSSPNCRFQPPRALAGQSLDHALPEGADARFWKCLLNEVQIILHQYRDQSEVGGLWFWGAGMLPDRSVLQPRYQNVYSSDRESLALADWLGLSHRAQTAPTLSAQDLVNGSLIWWEADSTMSADDNLQVLASWLRPLWRRLLTRRIDAVELSGSERAWRLSTAQAWQFWRRRAELEP